MYNIYMVKKLFYFSRRCINIVLGGNFAGVKFGHLSNDICKILKSNSKLFQNVLKTRKL